MANRRMFSKAIVCSDKFLGLPHTSQVLYFQLCMNADDDGFVGSPKSIARMIGANDIDMRLLMESELVYLFESGVIVVMDWKVNNQIKGDRYVPTIYQDEKALLKVCDSKRYRILGDSGKDFVPGLEPQYSIEKESKDKESEDKKSIEDVSSDNEFDYGDLFDFEEKTQEKPHKKKRTPKVAKAVEYTPDFEKFWENYPPYRRNKKQDAFKSWQGALETGVTAEYIIRAVRVSQKKNPQWREENGKFTPSPATWLNNHGWEDVLADDMRIQKEEDDYLANPVMKPDEHVRKLEPGMDIWDLLDD